MTFRILTVAALTGLAALSFSTAAVPAQDRPVGPLPSFEEIDANGDGVLTSDELADAREAAPAARFAAADTDGDGTLSRDEMLAARDARADSRIDRMIERADSNDDGALSLEEMEAAAEAMREARGERQGRRGRDGHGFRGGRHGGPAAQFQRLDADGDGRITPEEWTARGPRR